MNSLSTQYGMVLRRISGLRGCAKAAVVAVLCIGLAACATIGASPEAAVRERATARWNALLKGDFQEAYAYLSAGSKAVLAEKDYVARLRKGFWKSARVEKVECATPTSCDVALTIEYEYQGRLAKTPLRETWIRDSSEWWYVQK